MDNPDFLISYGLFFVGLNDDAFYWEIVIANSRKIVFILCGSLLANIDQLAKVTININ